MDCFRSIRIEMTNLLPIVAKKFVQAAKLIPFGIETRRPQGAKTVDPQIRIEKFEFFHFFIQRRRRFR
uniref:Uncharacterized protein n=1 Tax=Romanomermis culicivorax TaxID=13658 RepID=A0A915HQB7_ROMCU